MFELIPKLDRLSSVNGKERFATREEARRVMDDGRRTTEDRRCEMFYINGDIIGRYFIYYIVAVKNLIALEPCVYNQCEG